MSKRLDFDKAEFRDFMKRNTIEIAIRLVSFLLLLLFYVLLLLFAISHVKLNTGISGLDYEYVLISDEPAGENTYVKYLNLNTVEAKGKSIHVNTYMQQKDTIYRQDAPMYSEHLASNEIVVSKKVAEQLNIEVGSIVQLEFVLAENVSRYIVKDMIEYVTDYYNVKENNDFSVVLIGNDEKLLQQHRNQYVSFLNEDELNSYKESTRGYKDLFYAKAEKEEVKNKSIMAQIIMCMVHVLISGTYFIGVRTFFAREIKRYRYDGFPLKSIKYFIGKYRRCVVLPPWLAAIGIVLFVGRGTLSWNIWVGSLCAEMILYSLLWIRNDMYGKATGI